MSQQINLLNPELLTSKEWIDARMMALLAGVTAMLMVMAYGWASYRVAQLAREQQAVTLELASLKQQLDLSIQQHVPRTPSKALQDDVAMAEATLTDRQQVLTFLQGGGFGNAQGFSGYMEAFARQSMKGLWLTGFSIDDSVSKIGISGRALRPDFVPQYISGLRQEPILKGREFAELEMNAVIQSPLSVNSAVSSSANAASTSATTKQGAMPGPKNATAGIATPAIVPPTIIEFKLQSQEKKAEASLPAPVGRKS